MILAEDAKREIKRLQKQVYKLRKSFIFFNEKYESGVEFPAKKITRHSDLS
jgi:mRNA-degrading endonuclease RelE of RelBE toxin-antitoxin system